LDWSKGNVSLTQAANGRFVAIISAPSAPGIGRLLPHDKNRN
jgi:hypothetical protein